MKFFNKLYPNGKFLYKNDLKSFKDGVYVTDDKEEIEHLKTKVKHVTSEEVVNGIRQPENVEIKQNQGFKLPEKDEITVDELKMIANRANLKGWTALNKDDLYDFINKSLS